MVFTSTFSLPHNSFLRFPAATCGEPPLNRDVIATPTKAAYQIGDRVSLSCPARSVLDGEESEILCNPSLLWSPSPESIHCKAGMFVLRIRNIRHFQTLVKKGNTFYSEG